MTRIKPLAPLEMNEAQTRIYRQIAGGKRGTVPAPLQIWLHSAELAGRAQHLGEFVRYDTTLPPRLSELAILVTARFWTAHYEWYAHKKAALLAGLDPQVVEAIATRREPPFEAADERIVYNFCRALHHDHRLPDELYRQAVTALGEQSVVELVGLLGYYTLISMTLNAFEVELPEGATPELAD